MHELNTCNCCDGVSVDTPAEIINRPGLNAIAYRVGTHAQFKQSLLARISLSGHPSLKNLTTRDNDDFSIALLDSWSVVADVLTFYQERIANENYLRTARERFSVLEMARLIGYELRPGVSAGTYLAFTLDESPAPLGPVIGTDLSANKKEGLPPISIGKGTKVQSVPGPGEKAQTFETDEPIDARAEWNAIKPRLTQPLANIDDGLLVFKGIANNLKEGDILLTRSGSSLKMKKILKVSLNLEAKTTWVYFVLNAGLPGYERPAVIEDGNVNELLAAGDLDEAVVEEIINTSWQEEDLAMLIATNKWSEHELVSTIGKLLATVSSQGSFEVFVFRKRAFAFGYNAPKKLTLTNGIPSFTNWTPAKEKPETIFLDSAYEEILPGSYFAIQTNADMVAHPPDVYLINNVDVRSHTDYDLSTRSTEINFTPKSATHKWWGDINDLSLIQSLIVYVQSEKLELDELPIMDEVMGNSITLGRYFPGLKTGQTLILTGDRSDLNGVSASEVVQLKEIILEKGFTVLIFIKSLAYTYVRSTVSISANVALATNGETVEEILGSGDAGKPFQQFTLRQPPLTYISASSATGTETTLEVRVNDILWHEVENFLDHLPEERIYITRQDNEGKTTVIFGDGITGARLPSGKENVKAKYRKGIGLGGLVKANQLSQLMTRPLGVKSAVNPLASSGAADPEGLDEARQNAPLGILTLGRVVSLQDYQDFSRSFAGIEKALATWTWVGQKRHVFITVAGANGEAVTKESKLYDNLLDAIRKSGDPKVELTLESYRPRFFRLHAGIQTHPDYLVDKVLEEVEQSLRDRFSFASREFGQPVSYSEVVSVMQQVEGVIAVDVDKLYYSDQPEELTHHLQAGAPITGDQDVFAAELLLLDPRPTDLKIIT